VCSFPRPASDLDRLQSVVDAGNPLPRRGADLLARRHDLETVVTPSLPITGNRGGAAEVACS